MHWCPDAKSLRLFFQLRRCWLPRAQDGGHVPIRRGWQWVDGPPGLPISPRLPMSVWTLGLTGQASKTACKFRKTRGQLHRRRPPIKLATAHVFLATMRTLQHRSDAVCQSGHRHDIHPAENQLPGFCLEILRIERPGRRACSLVTNWLELRRGMKVNLIMGAASSEVHIGYKDDKGYWGL